MANINEAWIISQAFIGASLYRPQNFGEKLYGPLHLTFKKKKQKNNSFLAHYSAY